MKVDTSFREFGSNFFSVVTKLSIFCSRPDSGPSVLARTKGVQGVESMPP